MCCMFPNEDNLLFTAYCSFEEEFTSSSFFMCKNLIDLLKLRSLLYIGQGDKERKDSKDYSEFQ